MTRNLLKIRLIVSLWLLSFVFAIWNPAFSNIRFPKHCYPFKLQNESIVLKNKLPVLILITNKNKNDIWITHIKKDNPGASAGFASKLANNHWSALVLDKPEFSLRCIEERPGHEQQITCQDVLVFCILKNKPLSKTSNQGTFWAGENLLLPDLKSHLLKRNIEIL